MTNFKKLNFILHIIALTTGSILIIGLLFIICLENSIRPDFQIFYFMLPIFSSFLSKSCSLFCYWKNLNGKSVNLQRLSFSMEWMSRFGFLSVALYMMLCVDDCILPGVISIFFINFLLLQDYFQKLLKIRFTMRQPSKYKKVFIVGSISFECFALLASLIYTMIQSNVYSVNIILFRIGTCIYILNAIPLRCTFSYNKLITKTNKYVANKTDCEENKQFRSPQTLENQSLDNQVKIENEFKSNYENHVGKFTTRFQETNNNNINSVYQKQENTDEILCSKFNTKDSENFIKINKSIKNQHNKQTKLHQNSSCFSFIQTDSNNPLFSARPYKIQKLEPINELWEFLPTIFDEGIAIFEEDKIVKFNLIFFQYVVMIVNQDIMYEDLYSNWGEIFQKISVFSCDSTLLPNNLFQSNLSHEIQKIMSSSMEDFQSKMPNRYTVSKNNQIIQFSIFKKSVSDTTFTILKTENIQNDTATNPQSTLKNAQIDICSDLIDQAAIPLNYLKATIDSIECDISLNNYNKLKSCAKMFKVACNGISKFALVKNLELIKCCPESFSIVTILQKVIESANNLFENRGIKLIFESKVIGSENFICHDKIIIETIIFQLLLNSLKYAQNEKVTVELLYDMNDNDFQISITEAAIGIPNKKAENLMTYFSTDLNSTTEMPNLLNRASKCVKICKSLLSIIHKGNNINNRISFTSINDMVWNITVKISKKCSVEKESLVAIPRIKLTHKINSLTSLHYRAEKSEELAEESEMQRNYEKNNQPQFELIIKNHKSNISKEQFDEKKNLIASQQIKLKKKTNSLVSLSSLIPNPEKLPENADLQSIGSETKLPQFYSTIKNNLDSKFLNSLNNNLSMIPCNCPFRTLIIDKDESTVVSFKRMYSIILKKTIERYELLVGHDGQEGYNIFFDYFENKTCGSSFCCPIKLIVVDYNTPLLTGPTVVSKMIEYLLTNLNNTNPKIYGWATSAEANTKTDFIKAGVIDIFLKPLKKIELSQVLSEFCLSK